LYCRGFPGYQCPYCQKTGARFHPACGQICGAWRPGAPHIPGPPADLDQHAKEFLSKQDPLSANLDLVIDPDYAVTNQYGLRWDAPHETAYPSTFLIDRQGVVFFRRISHSHGDRTSAEDILADLERARWAANNDVVLNAA